MKSADGCTFESSSSVWSEYRLGSMGSLVLTCSPVKTLPNSPAFTSRLVMDKLSTRVCWSVVGCKVTEHVYRPEAKRDGGQMDL